MIAYLFLVQSGLFNNSSLSPYAFASVGTREEVGGTIIAVDWVWYGFGDARANFYAVADAGGCQEGQGERMGRRGTPGDAFGC